MWKWVKVPKGVALLAFVLPWMTVSCSGQPLFSSTGIQLVQGKMSPVSAAAAQQLPTTDGQLSVWLLAAVIAIAIGLVLSLLKFSKPVAAATAVTSVAAIGLIWYGTTKVGAEVLSKASEQQGGSGSTQGMEGFQQSMAQAIQIQWEFGLWLALGALAVALAMAALAISKSPDLTSYDGGDI